MCELVLVCVCWLNSAQATQRSATLLWVCNSTSTTASLPPFACECQKLYVQPSPKEYSWQHQTNHHDCFQRNFFIWRLSCNSLSVPNTWCHMYVMLVGGSIFTLLLRYRVVLLLWLLTTASFDASNLLGKSKIAIILKQKLDMFATKLASELRYLYTAQEDMTWHDIALADLATACYCVLYVHVHVQNKRRTHGL